MPKALNIQRPPSENTSSTQKVTHEAMRAMRMRSSALFLSVMAKKAGTVAMGSTITNKEAAESRVKSSKLIGSISLRLFRLGVFFFDKLQRPFNAFQIDR